MKKRIFFSALGAMIAMVLTVNSATAQQVARDNAEIRQDKRELRHDRRERNRDLRTGHPGRAREEQREINRDKRELRHDRRRRNHDAAVLPK